MTALADPPSPQDVPNTVALPPVVPARRDGGSAPGPAFPEDLALARRLAEGDAGAWETAVRRFTPMALAAARTAGRSREFAEDATEEFFLQLLGGEARALREYRGEAPLAAYLAVLARRAALRILKDERRRRLGPEQMDLIFRRLSGGGTEGTGPDPEDLARLREAIGTLPERQSFVLHGLLSGRSLQDLAADMGCPPGAVSTLAWRGRTRLRGILEKIRNRREIPGGEGPPL